MCLLAPTGDRGVSRDKILAYFWPESPTDNARHGLDQLLYAIRRQLGESLVLGPDPVRLNSDVITPDVIAFERLLSEGALADAVELYRGPFLDGFFLTDAAEFENWVSEERARLQGRYAAALASLVRLSEQQGHHDAGIEWRRRLAALDPLDGRIALGLIRALAESGDRPGALRHARAHETYVRQELGSPPDPAVRIFVEQLRTAELSPDLAHTGEPRSPSRPMEISAPRPTAPAPLPVPTSVSTPPPAAALASGARRAWSLPGIAAAIGISVPLVLALVFARRGDSGAPTPVPAATAGRVAILPFRVTAPDSSLSYLREGMVDLLAAKLTGESGPVAVDPRTTLSAWRRLGLSSDERFGLTAPLELTRSLEASQVLMGEVVVSTGGRIALHASLVSAAGRRVSARADVEGPLDSLPALVDRLAASLMALQAGEDEQRLASLASASLPALHAYLEGRAAYRRGDSKEALLKFSRALEIDSTFSLAAMEYLSAADRLLTWKLGVGEGYIYGIPFGRWMVEAGSQLGWERAREIAWRERARLAPHDRVYLAALLGSRYPDASSALARLNDWEKAVAILPDRADAWYRLGQVLLYQGRSTGVAAWDQRAGAAYRRAEQLDPSFPQPIAGLMELAARRHDIPQARRLAGRYLARDSTGPDADYVRWHIAALTGDKAALESIRGRFASLDFATLDRIQVTSQAEVIELGDADRALRVILERSADPEERSIALYVSQMLPLNRGRPREALALGQQQFKADSDFEEYSTAVTVPHALYWEGDTNAAARLIPRMVHTPVERYGAQTWRMWHGDTAGIARTLADMQACGERCSVWLLLLQGMLAVAEARPDAPALVSRIDSVVRTGCCSIPHAGDLIVARLEERLGNLPAALEAVRRQRWFFPPEFLSTALHEEGRLAVLTGDTAGAIAADRQYLVLRADAAPERQDDVRRVRAELERLER